MFYYLFKSNIPEIIALYTQINQMITLLVDSFSSIELLSGGLELIHVRTDKAQVNVTRKYTDNIHLIPTNCIWFYSQTNKIRMHIKKLTITNGKSDISH